MSWVRERHMRRVVGLPDPPSLVERIVGVGGGMLWLTIVMAALVFGVSLAKSHSFYPLECCSGFDCAPLASNRVQPLLAGGFMVDGTFYIPRNLVRDSMDGRYHACFPKPDNLRCFFAPPRGV